MAQWKHTVEAATFIDNMNALRARQRQPVIRMVALETHGRTPRAKLGNSKPVRPRKTK
jgi:hypothetical protein